MKKGIGALIILGGVALIGIYYFKKNKPTVASSQAKGLQALSNYYQSGSASFDETYIPSPKSETNLKVDYGQLVIGGVPQSVLANVDYTKLTPKEVEALKQSLGTIPDFSVTNQIAQNINNTDFSALSNLGLIGVTFNIPKK
jgi:hypothetical protein